jgi:hypothetical protein
MKHRAVTFLAGVLVGLLVGALGGHVVGQRYELKTMGSQVLRIDRWTGKTWTREYYRHSDGELRFHWAMVEDR